MSGSFVIYGHLIYWWQPPV